MKKSYEIDVQFNDGFWIAINDVLPIATEEKSLQGLIDRVNLIAPEIALENNLVKEGEALHLIFKIESDIQVAA